VFGKLRGKNQEVNRVKKLYKRGALLTFLILTVDNLRWLKNTLKKNEIKDPADIFIGMAVWEIIAAFVSLTWFVTLPYVYLSEKTRNTPSRQDR
jgi:hypothetical protein